MCIFLYNIDSNSRVYLLYKSSELESVDKEEDILENILEEEAILPASTMKSSGMSSEKIR